MLFKIYIFLPCLLISVISESIASKAVAGVNNYTNLDKIDKWIIQRKLNDVDQSFQCRAVLPTNGTWFGSNIRITKYGKLIVPDGILYSESENSQVLSEVRSSLEKCRLDFIYF